MVLSFLQGLALDAYVTVRSAPKWAICVDSPALLDDLQAVLTNLGIVHSRVAKYNREYDKTYGEVYATGSDAQRLVSEVPFLEPDKAARAAELWQRVFSGNDAADVIPGLDPRALYELLPKGWSGRSGKGSGIAHQFRFLCDRRTRNVSRRTLELVADVDGVVLPTWLQTVLDDKLHFSPVESVDDAGLREVFDVSVPTTHAFVANGVVNHNTVNLPEEATVEELEQLHIEAWRLGLKSVAVYRDNCKVGQPLSTQKKAGAAPTPEHGGEIVESTPERIVERVVEHLIVQEPVRQKLPRVRASKTFSFRVADCHGYVTVGEFEDGRPGELFLRVAKQGSTLAGIMDAFAISVSHGLQYGVPIEAFCEMFTNMRFEPAGMTDDPDIRFATSLVDYIFRRLAVEYMHRGQAPRHGRSSPWGSGSSRRCPASRKRPRRRSRSWSSSRPTTAPRRRPVRDRAGRPGCRGADGAGPRARDRPLLRLRRHHAAGRHLPRLPVLRRYQRLFVAVELHPRCIGYCTPMTVVLHGSAVERSILGVRTPSRPWSGLGVWTRLPL